MNKKLIAILTLVMFAMTLLPMGAFAITKNQSSGAITTVTTTGTKTLATIVIEDDALAGASFTSGGTLSLVLPSGVEWDATQFTVANPLAGNAATPFGTTGVVFEPGTSTMANTDITISSPAGQRLNISFGGAGVSVKGARLYIKGAVDVKTVGTGDIVVAVEQINTGISTNSVTIGRFDSSSVTASVLGANTKGIGSHVMGTISFRENAAMAWGATDEVRLRLPNGFDWDAVGYGNADLVANPQNITATNGSVFQVFRIAGDTTRDIRIKRTGAANANPGILDFASRVIIKSDAPAGDITVSTSGKVSESFVIGKHAELGVTITAQASKNVIAGRDSQEVARINIKEAVMGSLTPNRTIRFTLPSGVEFDTTANINLTVVTANNGFVTINGDGSTANTSVRKEKGFYEYMLPSNATFTSTPIEYRITFTNIDVLGSAAAGDLNITVAGTAGANGEVKVAEIAKPVIVSTTSADIVIGRQGQPLNDIYITETRKEMLKLKAIGGTGAAATAFDNSLVLEAPVDASWATTPKVEVVEGDVIIKEVKRASDNTRVQVIFEGESTVPSKLKVSGLSVTTNRSIPEGDFVVGVRGPAVSDSTTGANVMTFKAATVVTPSEDGTVKPVVMTVGSTVYTIDGIEMTMDVAPYIKDGRTYFPVRYVAQALGITADNVVWDGAQRTVTIFRANRIVQVTIGSSTMLVNGVPLTMDAAPEITAERTMLPIRFVAQGLGVNVNWDAATQTVTLN